MRTERSLYDSESEDLNDSSLTISLLNTRSLNKHLIDIAHDERLLKNDVICLTETQLSALSNHQRNHSQRNVHLVLQENFGNK